MTTNKQAKQEAIKAAWIKAFIAIGETTESAEKRFDAVKSWVDQNGTLCGDISGATEEVFEIETIFHDKYFRPISLRGIENNSGWERLQPSEYTLEEISTADAYIDSLPRSDHFPVRKAIGKGFIAGMRHQSPTSQPSEVMSSEATAAYILEKHTGHAFGLTSVAHIEAMEEYARTNSESLEKKNKELREALEICIEFVEVLEEKRIVSNWSGLPIVKQALERSKQ